MPETFTVKASVIWFDMAGRLPLLWLRCYNVVVGVKLKVSEDGERRFWSFACQACRSVHQVDGRWMFDGNLERPTFAGSVLVHADERIKQSRCHSFVTSGLISYYCDSTHAFAGQVLELPDWDFSKGLGGADS